VTGEKGNLDQQLSTLKNPPKVPSSFEAWTPSGTGILAEIVAILQKGAKPNQRDANGKTVLMKLIEYPQFTQLEYKQIVEALVNGGLSLSVQDYDGATALHYAVKEFVRKYDPKNDRQHNLSGYQNEIGLIKLLIEMGSPYRKDSDGKLPIDYLTDTVWFNPVRDLFRQRILTGSIGAGSGSTSGGRKTKKASRKLRKTRRR